jgi:transposase-like protein
MFCLLCNHNEVILLRNVVHWEQEELMMQKRMHSREFKLDMMHQIASGQKQPAQLCREYNLYESLLSRWRREYRERGEAAFLPQQFGEKIQEYLEKKRAWDRNYYQRHKIERQAANYERRARLYEHLQQIKSKASCVLW